MIGSGDGWTASPGCSPRQLCNNRDDQVRWPAYDSRSHYEEKHAKIMGTPLKSTSILLLYALLLLTQPALSDDLNCQSVIGAVEIDDNIVIAAPCTLNGTTVDGNIKIFSGGSLTATGAVIDGNIEADTADFVAILDSEVDGKIELESMVGDLSYVRDSLVEGKLKLKENRSRIEVQGNYIGDDLEVDKNVGGVFIGDNIVEGDLECKSNKPAPVGDNNFVSGKTKNQCRDLEAPEVAEDPEPGKEPVEPPADADPVEPPEDPAGEPPADTGEPPEDPAGEPPADTGEPTQDSGDDEPPAEPAAPTDDSGDNGSPVNGGTAAVPQPTNLTPPGQLNTGTGGGGSTGSTLIALLLAACLMRMRRRATTQTQVAF